MDNFHQSEQATNMSAGGLSDRSSLPMGDNFHHPDHGTTMPSGGMSDRSPLPLSVEQDQPVQSWSSTAAQEDVAADYSMFPAAQNEGEYTSQQMTDIVHQTYMHSGLTPSESYEGDHMRDMTRQQGLDMFSGRALNMADTYEPRGSLGEQHTVEVYEPRVNLNDQHAMDLFQMKDVAQDTINKGKDVPSVGRILAEPRGQPPLKLPDHISDTRHLSLSDIQDLRRAGMSGVQTMCKPSITDDGSYTVMDRHYNNRPNMEVASAANMSDTRYQSLIDSISISQRVNDSRSLSAVNTSRHLMPALSPQYADERPPRMATPPYAGNHGNRPGRSVGNLDAYNTKSGGEMFQADKVDTAVGDRNIAIVSLSQHRTVSRNPVDIFTDRPGGSFGPCQQMFEDSVRTSSSRTANTNANFVYAESAAPIVKARHLCFQDDDAVHSKAACTNVSFSFVDNSVPISKISHQMYEDDLRPSQVSTSHSEFVSGVLTANGGSNQGSGDVVTGRSDQEVLLTDKEWNQVTRLKLFHMMTNKKMCDVSLKAGDLRIEIHKVVLCSASDTLAMLLDSVDNDGFPVLSTNVQVSEEVLHSFAEFLYLGSVKVTVENINDMNTLANAFHVYALHDLCWEVMEKNGTGGNIRLLDLKLTFESKTLQTTQKKDCGINTESTVNVDPDNDGSIEDKQLTQSEIKTGPAGKGRGKGRSRAQVRSKNLTDETNSPKPIIEKTGPVTHNYGTRGVAKKRVFEESVLEENNKNKLNQKADVKAGVQTVTPKRKRMNSSKTAETEANEITVVTEPIAASIEVKAVGDDKDGESVGKAPVKLRHRSWKQKLMQSVTEDSALDTSVVVNFNPLGKLMIDEDNDAVGDDVDDGSDHASVKGKKGKKARARKVPVPPNVQMTVRPPPKKRAKMELKRLRLEEEELGLSLNMLDETIEDLPLSFPPVQEAPPKIMLSISERIKKKQKQKRCRVSKNDVIGQIALKLESLADHIRFHLRQYKCDLCGNEFVFPKRSVTHLINTHNVDVDEVMSYVTVRERVEDSPKICDICGYKSKDPNFYYVHIHKYFRHGIPLPKGWKPFSCDICGKELFTKFQLKDHRRVHFEETPFICQICGQGFKSRTCLNSHMFHRHSDERKHQCPECSKSFKTRTQRMVHLRIHSGEKPYQCPECSYKSTTRGNMQLHLVNRHKLDQQTAKSMMRTVLDGIKCDIKPALEQDLLENQTFDIAASQDTNGNMSGNTGITLAAAEHAMHAILLPLAQGDHDGTSLSSQTIATYVVAGTVPLTGAIGETITLTEQDNQNTSPIGQQDQQCSPMNSASQTHLYMQHSPISPPPQSVSPQTTYVTTTHNITALSPVNPANHQQGSSLVTDDSIGSGSDAAIIQAYYQQQFYSQHY